ncbi:MAG: GNAT family N-acetyltransferase [Acidobacteriota bacterium]
MAAGTSIEILDLRHFAAPILRPLLEAEGELWSQRLHWDYRASARLLMQYLDSHMLPGYAAIEAKHPIGYVFSVYEECKAIIGEVFALAGADGPASAHAVEETLLKHLLELMLNSPQVERIESQLLLHPSGSHSAIFRAAGFEVFPRLFMVQTLSRVWAPPAMDLPAGLELRAWSENDLGAAAKLICEAYRGHPDSLINDQYRTLHGSARFLNNIVRYAGCGTFSAPVSHVVVDRARRELVALVLGSRVSAQSGHITQLCVHPGYRRRGLGRLLLSVAAFSFMRQAATEISLTVTEANRQAIQLYRDEGYACRHIFDAAVWQRGRKA